MMTCINVVEFVLISSLEKGHSMIETRCLKNVVIFIQKILDFALSRKTINIYNDIASKLVALELLIIFSNKLFLTNVLLS